MVTLVFVVSCLGSASVVPDAHATLLKDGQRIGQKLNAQLEHQTSFGVGDSGTIKGNNFKSLTFSPMNGAIGANKSATVLDAYGNPLLAEGNIGIGSLQLGVDTDLVSSGSYGTKTSGNDKAWCLVLTFDRVWVKFTNLNNGFPYTVGRPLTCHNGQ